MSSSIHSVRNKNQTLLTHAITKNNVPFAKELCIQSIKSNKRNKHILLAHIYSAWCIVFLANIYRALLQKMEIMRNMYTYFCLLQWLQIQLACFHKSKPPLIKKSVLSNQLTLNGLQSRTHLTRSWIQQIKRENSLNRILFLDFLIGSSNKGFLYCYLIMPNP